MFFTPKEKGQGLAEYALILVSVAIVVIVVMAILSPGVSAHFVPGAADTLDNAADAASNAAEGFANEVGNSLEAIAATQFSKKDLRKMKQGIKLLSFAGNGNFNSNLGFSFGGIVGDPNGSGDCVVTVTYKGKSYSPVTVKCGPVGAALALLQVMLNNWGSFNPVEKQAFLMGVDEQIVFLQTISDQATIQVLQQLMSSLP